MGVVYCITNTLNNKMYIGIDSRGLDKRWKEHKKISGYTNPTLLIDKKIKEYGIENFTYTTLYESESIEELRNMEVSFIEEYDTFIGNGNGYNMTLGGDINPMENEIVRQIHKRAMEEKCSGEKHYMWGKKQPKEINKKRSKTLKGRIKGDKNPSKRPDVRKKISRKAKARKGKLNPNFKYNIKENGLRNFLSTHTVKETSIYFGCSTSTVERNMRKFNISNKRIVNINKKTLFELYIVKNKTVKECASHFNCSVFPIKMVLREEGWKKRKSTK